MKAWKKAPTLKLAALLAALLLAACSGAGSTDDPEAAGQDDAATEADAGGTEGGDVSVASEPAETEAGGPSDASATATCNFDESQEPTEIVYGMLAGGAGLLPAQYITTSNIAEQYGINLVLRPYDDLATYYADGAQGVLDVVYGSPDAFAPQASQGVPIHLVSTMTPWHGWLVAHDDLEFEDPTSLEGTRLSTIAASGTFQTLRGALSEWYGMDLESAAEIIGAGNPAAAMTQVSAGTADVGLSWEPSVTAAMLDDPALSVVYDLGAEFEERYGMPMWHFVMVMQNENDWPEGTEDCFVAMYQEAARSLHDDPAEADRLAQEVGFEPGVVQEALESGRLVYDIRPIDADIRASIEQGLDFLPPERVQGDIPDTFWGAAS